MLQVIDYVKGLPLLCRHVLQVCKAFNLEGRMSICQMPPSTHHPSPHSNTAPAADSLWRAQQQQQQQQR